MSNYDLIRAWKDEDYFESLSEKERSLVPENPAGIIELSDEEMENVAGGVLNNTAICINIENNVDASNNINIFNNNSFGDCGITNNGGYCNFDFSG